MPAKTSDTTEMANPAIASQSGLGFLNMAVDTGLHERSQCEYSQNYKRPLNARPARLFAALFDLRGNTGHFL
jgi:hypothetical protein